MEKLKQEIIENQIIKEVGIPSKLVTTKKIVPINNIIPNSFNPNKMSKHLFEKMKEAIKEKGLFGSIFVVPFAGCYKILDGEHRWLACKELNWREIPVEIADHEMEDKEVKFWTVYFNNTRGKDDIELRAKIFESLDKGQLQLMPFTEEEIENEKELFKFDFAKYEKQEIMENKPVNRTIIFPVTEEEYQLWQKTKEILKQNKKTELQFLINAIDDYLAVNLGRCPGQKQVEI